MSVTPKEMRSGLPVRNEAAPDPADALVPEWAGEVDTPAFVYDVGEIHRLLDRASGCRERAGLKLLFAVKSFSFADALEVMVRPGAGPSSPPSEPARPTPLGRHDGMGPASQGIDGFAVSSLYEARLARRVLSGGAGKDGIVSVTTPGLRPQDAREIASLCDSISFNSLNQWDMHYPRMKDSTSCGLRVNPQLPFADDLRYDPCRPHSKLGVPLDVLAVEFRRCPERFAGLEGVLFHSNCDSTDFGELEATVQRLDAEIPEILSHVQWVNLGGGYLFEDDATSDALCRAVIYLKSRYDVDVLFEPGSGLVRDAGCMVSTVLDLFESGGRTVAVLDTSVNHLPEVFEYGYQPDVMGHDDDAPHEYILAGCTCLAGDLFGEYRFHRELRVGDRVVFGSVGSYSLVKAHMFNGVALPSVYAVDATGQLTLKSSPSFDEFAARWGMATGAPA